MFDIDYVFEQSFLSEKDVKDICVKASMAVAEKLSIKDKQSLTLKISNDIEIQELNKMYRGKDKPTNVLSFPSGDEMPGMEEVMGEDRYIGDIIISVETLERESVEQSKPIKDHFTHLFVHSLLHLLGYDHIEEMQANEMESLEIDILSHLGVNNPYYKVVG